MLEKQGTFLTATTNIRPKTSHITRNKQSLHELVIDPEVGAAGKIKIYKDELKKLHAQYVDRLKSINQSKKNVGKQYRDSQKKKVQFINLYENRKLKLTEQKLLQQKETRLRQYQKQVRDRAKTLKLNGQIRSLLIKNEIQQSNSVKTYKNKQQKNVNIPNPEIQGKIKSRSAKGSIGSSNELLENTWRGGLASRQKAKDQ